MSGHTQDRGHLSPGVLRGRAHCRFENGENPRVTKLTPGAWREGLGSVVSLAGRQLQTVAGFLQFRERRDRRCVCHVALLCV